ncbi:hypothetical protein C3747_91g30 [Trypanosoma cruzi]|uniref:Uncharacterized protein n=2 Tax=Trypanosoma cruzi TaxID=5693 RepID=Q4E3G0_TRYCC|nr:uncharacterized protein Tc00.1047053507611.320 [Trypanosoma cruzi]EAN99319.1 hypothetical protein, conserved [Trypanosoma cruzi]KAF8291684.1 hypothetical protein TcYC6_0121130 [Trypanosoma cruzi]PWV08287.1 hypothetical protein C3747_91g30 [Trypanosoma cruzi]|eukprot:XP_821170.1 hypothetical protein [Trypanosoma cruzi strain CL Brener]
MRIVRWMSALEEHAFLELLRQIEKERYAPNLGERAILCRTLNSAFNPIGMYFASVGALCGLIGANHTQRLFWRMFGMLMGSMYSFEASWAFQEQQPCFSFFNDIRSVDGQLREKASEYHLVVHLQSDHRRPLQILFDFFTFDKTSKWLISSRSISVDPALWLPHFRMEWFEGLPLDPLTIWYWGFALSYYKPKIR